MSKSILAAMTALWVAAGSAGAQTLHELEQKEAEVAAAWERTPLTVRRAFFVTERAKLYGAYTERRSNVFKPGEPLLTYVEPVGYAWTPGPNGFAFGVTLDFLIKGRDGKILGGQEKFLNFSQTSRHKVRELMVNVSLDVAGAPPGEYVVEYRLRDIAGNKTATFEQPFRIAP